MGDFVAGLDLGQVGDFSALIIVEEIEHRPYDPAMVRTITTEVDRYPNWDARTRRIFGNEKVKQTRRVLLDPDGSYGDIPPDDEPSYDVRHIHRWKLGTPYPKIVDDVVTMMMGMPLRGECPLVVDGTGVGRPVVDMFYQHPRWDFPLTPVVITSGQAVTVDQGYTHVPKRDLVGAVQVVLQGRRLRFPEASKLREVDTLIAELSTFKTKITLAANEVSGAWRERDHDDLVLSLALAVWYAERCAWRGL